MEEKIFTINLRNAISKVAKWNKSKRSAYFVRDFLKRHMKGDEIKIGQSITEEIWKRGDQNPPSKIRIKAIETEEGEGEEKKKIIKAEMLGVVFPEELKKEKKKEKPKEEKKEEVKTEEKPKEIKPEQKIS
jgi:large subunit ribosomal protein L31e